MTISPIRPAPVVDEETAALLFRWETYLRGEGKSEMTIAEAVRSVRRYASMTGNPVNATAEDVGRFLADKTTQGTRSVNFTYLHSFYRFLVMTGRREDDPMVVMKPPKVPRRTAHPITTEELTQLLNSRMHRRTRLMILLAAYQGLRVHEIAKVRGEDVDLSNSRLRVRGKGGHDAWLPLHPAVIDLAGDMNCPLRGWWFPTYVGNRLGDDAHLLARSISTIIANAMRRAGVRGSAHALRHWYGTELVRSGADLRTTQELMRHASLQTTQIYVAVSDKQMTDAALRLPDVPVVALPATPNVDAMRRRLFHRQVGATPAQVRSWAKTRGWDVAKHGQLPWAVLDAYRTGSPVRPIQPAGEPADR